LTDAVGAVMKAAMGATDISDEAWVVRLAPAPARPFLKLARLDRPIGTWLLLYPCWWGLALAPRPGGFGWVDLWFAGLFAVGAVVMRGAGCTVNDILDRDIDARVERTRSRPIPSGAIGVPSALLFLVLQLLIGLLVLLQFDGPTAALGAASLVLVFTYPLMKRVTWWPQAFLGLTFNWGALVGWSAVDGRLAAPALVLYAAGVAWTIGYDTIYAHQDREDDARIGIKSTALLFGDRSRLWVGLFYAATVALLAAAAVLAGVAWPVWPFLALAAWQLAWQVAGWRLADAGDSLLRFRSNRHFALLVLAGLFLGRAVA
jgi:4-hydroxybenzoate polyprenyltransferase